MKIFVDIDNTICVTTGNNYQEAVPIRKNIDKINKLFKSGHEITYWTARGGTSGIDLGEFTYHQLKKWKCKFHTLKMGKPSYDLFIEDKSIKIDLL